MQWGEVGYIPGKPDISWTTKFCISVLYFKKVVLIYSHHVLHQVTEQIALLERWVEFDQCFGCLGDWLTLAEEKVRHEVYGSTLEEVASFGAVLEVRR